MLIRRSRSTAALALFVSLASLAPSRVANAIAAPRPMHGTPYQVLVDPAHRPRLNGDKLVVHVSFVGCGRHRFLPRTQRQTAGLYVWFLHNDGDRCTTAQMQRLETQLTREQLAWGHVFLMTPNAGTFAVSR